MSNKKKFEKNITKKLEKMYARAKKNPSTESRLLFVSGKYGFSVIRMEEKPGSGKSFVDFADLIMSETVINAVSTSNTGLRQNIASLKVSMYDGDSLARSFDTKRSVFGTPVDYAKMQGIDLDEASDRQRDNYVDHSDGRKAVIMHVNGTNEGLKFKNLYEQATTHIEKLKQELNEAHEKAAEDRKKIEELEKKVLDAGKNLTFCYAKNTQLQNEKDAILAQLSAIKEDREERDKFCDKMTSTTNEDTNADASANDAAEELETVSDVLSDEAAVEALAKNSKTTLDTKEGTDDYKYVVNTPFTSPVHNDELPDDYMVTLLQNTKKPYNLRTIFKLQSYIYNDTYNDVMPDVYEALIGIHDPRTTNVRKFSRTAYAAAIALSVPEGYDGIFIGHLIEDYNCGNFKPTDPKYVPEDFPKFLKSLRPDIARIHRLLHTKTQLLPYVYKKEDKNGTKYFTIGPRPYDKPSDIKLENQYVAIPKCVDPYDFLEYDKTRELVMVFNHMILGKRRAIQFSLNDMESPMGKEDNVQTLEDQIIRYIDADEEGLIALDYNKLDELLEKGLWFYPVVQAWSEPKHLVKYAPTKLTDEISSEPKQDSNEK